MHSYIGVIPLFYEGRKKMYTIYDQVKEICSFLEVKRFLREICLRIIEKCEQNIPLFKFLMHILQDPFLFKICA